MTPTPLRPALALVLAVSLSACDFSTRLDIDVPEHEARTVVTAILVTDSVAVVRLGVSSDPYRSVNRFNAPATRTDAVVTLLRDGEPVEVLGVQSMTCEAFSDPRAGRPGGPFECGPHRGTVPLEAGGLYTVRAEVPGLPTAEGTVTMPRAPLVTAEEVPASGDGYPPRRRFRVSVEDPAGQGDLYGVSVLVGPTTYETQVCDPPDFVVCRDTVVTDSGRFPESFESSDPVILAAAREIPGEASIRFVSVDDRTFDGRTWTFTLSLRSFYGEGQPLSVQVAGLSSDLYDAYLSDRFGADADDNPFAEPANRPSNVTGGYGLVGAVALSEVRFGVDEP